MSLQTARACLTVFLLSCLWLTASAAAQDAFKGTFASGGLTVTLEQSGDSVTGAMRIEGSDCPIKATLADQRITGTFEFKGASIPFEAALDHDVLIVTSGGESHRLPRQVVEGNPLARKDLSRPSASGDDQTPAHPATAPPTPDDSAALAAKYPQVLSFSSGASIRCPSDWKVQRGTVTTLTPSGQLLPLTNYMLWTIPWTGQAFGTQAAGLLTKAVSQVYPGLKQAEEAQMLGAAPTDGVHLRFNGTSLLGIDFKVEMLARPQGNAVVLLVGTGDDAALSSSLPTAKEMMRTVAGPGGKASSGAQSPGGAGPASGSLGPLDPALVGTWRNTESHSDAAAGASLAIETVYTFKADGTFSLGSRAIGGDANTSADTGFKESTRGQWSAAGGVLTTVNQTGKRFQIGYLFHEGQLVFKLANNRHSFWSK